MEAPETAIHVAETAEPLRGAAARSSTPASFYCDSSYSNVAEAVLDNLQTAGIPLNLQPLERAAFVEGYSHKKLKNVILGGSGTFGNAATRLQAFVAKGGAYGNYPDLDALYQRQAVELDHAKRAAILDKMQRILVERTIYAPIWPLGFIHGVGPRVGQSGFGLITDFTYTAPFEDITLKSA